MPPRITSTRRTGALLATLLAALTAAGALALPAGGAQSPDALRQQVARQKSAEGNLSSAAARLGALEQSAARAVAVIEGRLAARQGELDAAQARLTRTQALLRVQRARLSRLQRHLGADRAALAKLLLERYEADKPDLLGVVLNAHGFSDLLDRVAFLHRIQSSDTVILDRVRTARADAHHQAAVLAGILPGQLKEAATVQRERDALASMTAGLQARRDALASAREARLAALQNSISSRHHAERVLTHLLAQQASASVDKSGPGGPWAIPWAIVQCESGGQNMPPNSATASGYYQFIDSTWQALGGSTPKAYLASKAEQDRLAARLWAGGSGARNWDCASIVGII